MDHINHFPLDYNERVRFLKVIQASLGVRRHYDLLSWLQGDLQAFLPHEILLAAWGDPTLGLFFVDVVSPLTAMRTEDVINKDITPFVKILFKEWDMAGHTAFQWRNLDGFGLDAAIGGCPINAGFSGMRSVVVHGIKNQRDRHVCLYAVFSPEQAFPVSTCCHMEMLLPYIDTALRQVAHLPEQRNDQGHVQNSLLKTEKDAGLSGRESEIVKWVRAGKTNQEIGLILGISAFTVKNHLQRIFQKLDVTNRAQVVDKLSQQRQWASG